MFQNDHTLKCLCVFQGTQNRILITLVTLPEVIISQKILKSCSEIPFFFFFYLREYRGQLEMSKILSTIREFENKQTDLEEEYTLSSFKGVTGIGMNL